jgi:glycosyltransferase involved in cell wall biosynthesis
VARLLCRAVIEPVRVLWLAKGLGPGGAERLLVSLARRIDLERFEVSAAYLLPEKDHLVPELEAAGVSSTCLDGARGVGWLGRLRELVQATGPEVVHIHAPQPAAMARPTLKVLRRRPAIVYTEHNSWDGYRLPTRLANAATYPLDDFRLAVSQTAFDSIPRLLRGRTEVLVHGVDLDEVRSHGQNGAEMRASLGLSAGQVLVVTVANLREHKDYPTLLAAARIVADSGAPVRFAAVGQGPLEDYVRSEIARLGLDGVFSLLGYRPDALDVLAAADVFTLSSVAEGYPVSLMEALALGKPVVATAVGGIPEAVRDGVEGRLVPPSSPTALAEALLAVAGDRSLREGMASAALERSALFDIGRAAARHEELYQLAAEDRSERIR